MTTDYSHLRDEYPEKISQDLLYTRRFKIRIDDVIIYLTKLENHPESLQTPSGIFSTRTKYRSIAQIQEPIDQKNFTKMLKKEWHNSPDVLTTNDVIKLIGYTQSTLSDWIIQGRIIGIRYYNKYMIPKDCLIVCLVK
ncbi:MAG: hypothetical protein ACOX4U_08375 [Anaerovoracaceae bacterium]|jgi:hypothetical protein